MNHTARKDYRKIHKWVEKHLGKPETCEDCGKSGLSGHAINWANISKTYQYKLNDWKRLCVACHQNFDMRNKKQWKTVCKNRHRLTLDNIYMKKKLAFNKVYTTVLCRTCRNESSRALYRKRIEASSAIQ